MISKCIKDKSGFGVCLIRDGEEVGGAATTYDVGTLAEIEDWDQLPDGLLGVSVRGGQRFRIMSSEVQSDQLTLARIELIDFEQETPLDDKYKILVELLQQIIVQQAWPYGDLEQKFEDARWVGYRLAELLPLPSTLKQEYLEMDDPVTRIENLSTLLEKTDLREQL